MLDRPLDLILKGLEGGLRAGIGGADKGLKCYRSLLLDLLERREIPKRHVEPAQRCQAFLRLAFSGIE
jgi:hypothetical protein